MTDWNAAYLGNNAKTFALRSGTGTNLIRFSSSSAISDQDYLSGMWAYRAVDPDGWVTNITVYYMNGATESYSMMGTSALYRLDSRSDATGNVMSFAYDDANSLPSRLLSVTIADGAQFNFQYTDSVDPWRITGATGPANRSVSFGYTTHPNGPVLLTSITDVVGIVSFFTYDSSRYWIQTLVTPYGTNSFTHVDNSFDVFDHQNPQLRNAGIDRSITITEADRTSKQVYLFYNNSYDSTGGSSEFTGKIPSAFSSQQIPPYTTAGDPPIQTIDTQRDKRNSHHWNRQQTAALSTLNLPNLTASDYRLSRTKHWLIEPNTVAGLKTISWEMPPSPDGSTESQPIFYDYLDKAAGWPANHSRYSGTWRAPSVISRQMPDGTLHYTYYGRNAKGLMTNKVTRWVENGTTKTRESTFHYATGTGYPWIDDILLLTRTNNGTRAFSKTLHPTAIGQIQYETDAVGNVTTNSYDSYNRLTSRQTQSGLTTTFTYDGTTGRLTNVVDAISGTGIRTNSYTWLNGYRRTHIDPRGFLRTFDHDLLGRLTQVTYLDSTTETYSYSLPASTGFNNTGSALGIIDLVEYKDRMGNYSRTLPNRVRQIEKVVEPSKTTAGQFGTEHSFSYCGCGSPTLVSRGSNTGSAENTNLDYNYQGKVRIVTLPNGTTVTNNYDVLGRLWVQEDALSKTTNVYDNLSRLVQRKNAAGIIEGNGYDDDDRIVISTNSAGVVVTNVYDDVDRILDRSYPSGGVEKWRYTAGITEPTSYTNQIGNVTTWAYDAAQRRTNEVGVSIYTNSFTYSPANDLLVLRDGKTNRTMWAYDLEGRMQFKTNQSNVRVLTNGYNANGLLTSSWTPAKGFRTNSYDRLGNLTQVVYTNTYYLNYYYDALSRLTNMADAFGTTTFTYSSAGDLLTENGPFSNDTITYSYHGSVPHLRTNLSLQQPTGTWTQSYAYDAAKRLQSVTSPAGTFTYDYSSGVGSATTASPLWKKLAMFSGSSAYITNIFDSSARITETSLKNSSHTALNQHTYLYNSASQRTYETLPNASTRTNFYDAIGQLLRSDSSTATEDRGYKYDAAQNLNARTNNTTPTTFNVNVRNELTSFSAAYDANGNLTNDSSRVMLYDDENRLIEVTVAGTSRVAFGYDGLSRLRTQMFYSWNGSSWIWGGTTRYIYDGRLVIQERTSSDTPTVAYTRGTDLSGTFQGAGGIGGMLARSSTYQSGNFTNHHAYHADVGGNITALVGTNQIVSATYRYEPFGKLIASSGTMAGQNLYRFSSKMFTSGDLYHYGYRFYDPNYQRWINQDPIAERGGINLYRFVSNDPIQQVDPFGLVEGDAGTFFGNLAGLGQAIGAALEALGLRAPEPPDLSGINPDVKAAMDKMEKAGLDPMCPPIGPAGLRTSTGRAITGFTKHGVDRAIGDTHKRAGVKPEAIKDALQNPEKVKTGTDKKGRPFEKYTGKDADVTINPDTGKVVQTNPRSGAGTNCKSE